MLNTAMRVSPLFMALVAATVAGGVLATVPDRVAMTTGVVLIVLGGWASSLCLHEFGHAAAAYRGGDREVRAKGYLTLDPRRYTDPVLSIVLPLLFVAIGGIPLPGGAVWINHGALRSRRSESFVSAAGPLMNLVLGAALALVVGLVPMQLGLAAGLSYLAFLQIIGFVLNVLPIPGLDGYGIVEPWLPGEARRLGAQARPWAPLVLFAAIIAIPVVTQGFFAVAHQLFDVVGGSTRMAVYGDYFFRFWER